MNFEWIWNKDAIGLIGRKGVGKTYLTRQLIEIAMHAKPHALTKADLWILDAKNQYPEYPFVYEATYSEYNGETVKKFIKKIYRFHDKLAVTDDLDLFIHRTGESEDLGNFLINAGTGRHIGIIWQSKRLANLDIRTLTESKYLVLGQGIFENDLKRCMQAGLDYDLYVNEIQTSSEVHKYILLNTFEHTNEIISDFK